MKRSIFFLLLASVVIHAAAQSGNPGALSQAVTMGFLRNPSNYLKPLDTLRAEEANNKQPPMAWNLFCQQMATFQSFAGEYRTALRYFDSLRQPQPLPDSALAMLAAEFNGYEAVSAKQAIVSMAASNKVTMINESHHIPYHRLLTTSLLQPLYDAGYRYLALEALSPFDEALNSRKYPVSQDGFYTHEPLFANMLRTAMQIGYTLVSYEDTAACETNCRVQREVNQARNLHRIIQKDPAAKVLVHVGISHLLEKEKNGFEWMGARFKKLTGIDPLTINQDIMCEKSDAMYQHKYYTAALHRYSITAPSVIMKEDSMWIEPANSGCFDVQVFHPAYGEAHGRPGYYMLDETRQPRLVKLGKTYNNVLVQAFVPAEKDPARLPMDHLVLHNGNSAYLLLPAGAFEVVVKDVEGRVLEKQLLQ